MGAGAYGLNKLLFLMTGSAAFSLVVSIIFAVLLYGILLFLFNIVNEE